MSKKYKQNKCLSRIAILLAIAFCGFILGFIINNTIYNVVEYKIASRPQIYIKPE